MVPPREGGGGGCGKDDGLRTLKDLDPVGKIRLFVQEVQKVHMILAHHVKQFRDQPRMKTGLHQWAQPVEL